MNQSYSLINKIIKSVHLFNRSILGVTAATFFALCISLFSDYANSVEKCQLSDGRKGYCRIPGTCFNVTDTGKSCPVDFTCCPSGSISLKKCQDYSKFVYSKEMAPVLLPSRRMDVVSQCRIEALPLIVGGTQANAKEFPHMVAIGFGKTLDEAEWLCGGSLISERFILTAAHCSKSQDKGPAIFARLGDLDLKGIDDESYVQDFIIIERIIHPEYAPPSRYHDIALFKLSSFVKINGFTRPACIHVIPNEVIFNETVATGWGKTDYTGKSGSNHLMKVQIRIIDYEECNTAFVADVGGKIMHDGVLEHQICAGDLDGGRDTCHGDSGGPIQIVLDNPYCMYDIIGVTSFGKFCGLKNSPAIYTKVSYYVEWIESIVWP